MFLCLFLLRLSLRLFSFALCTDFIVFSDNSTDDGNLWSAAFRRRVVTDFRLPVADALVMQLPFIRCNSAAAWWSGRKQSRQAFFTASVHIGPLAI